MAAITGRWHTKKGQAYPSTWLKSEDLIGEDGLGAGHDGDFVVTIKSCKIEEVGQGDDKEEKPVLKFRETEKGVVLNATNWDSISELHGEDSDDWIGKQITLYVDRNVKYAGKKVSGIRVRDHVPGPAPTAVRTNHSPNWTYEQAVAECGKYGITDKAMRGFLKTKGFPGYNGVACTPVLLEWFTHLEPPKDAPEVLFDDVPDPTDDDAPPDIKDRVPF